MHQRVDKLLDDIQIVLEKSGHWQSLPPEPEKMMSTEPFSIDTLSFLEWLQWVYVARLRAIIEADGTLPSGAQVHPYASESLKHSKQNIPGLLDIIEQLDHELS